MQNTLIAFVIAASLGGFAASAFGMTENDYRSERTRLKESYSFRFVDCNAFEGKQKRDCASKIRDERDAALDRLDNNYKANKKS